MKTIESDMTINGVQVCNLEELRQNFTTEILKLHTSGLLSGWLGIQDLIAEADKVASITTENRSECWLALLDAFGLMATELNVYEIIKGSDVRARAGLAGKNALPEHLQLKLLRDKDESVKIALAGNINLSPRVQSELADKGSTDVQICLAKNPTLEIGQQSQMVLYGNMDVRLALYSNCNLDNGVRVSLVQLFSLSDYHFALSGFRQQNEKLKQLHSAYRKYGDDNYLKYEQAEDELTRMQNKCSTILDVLDARCDADNEFYGKYMWEIVSLQCELTREIIRDLLGSYL